MHEIPDEGGRVVEAPQVALRSPLGLADQVTMPVDYVIDHPDAFIAENLRKYAPAL